MSKLLKSTLTQFMRLRYSRLHGTVLMEHLTLPLLVDVFEDVDANLEVAVEVDAEVDLLDVAENPLVDVEMLLVTLALPVLGVSVLVEENIDEFADVLELVEIDIDVVEGVDVVEVTEPCRCESHKGMKIQLRQ
eukprot:374480-Amphidinium_carterae.1